MDYYYGGEYLNTGTILVLLAISILSVIAFWILLSKAGEAGWKSIIPVYNMYMLYKISWGNGWYFLLTLIPLVNVVVAIMLQIKLARSFGKGFGFGLGLIFLNTIFMFILAFGSARYIGPDGQRSLS